MKTKVLAAALALGLVGCSSTEIRNDFHAASSTALGIVTAAKTHPELVGLAKTAIDAAAAKADPNDAPAISAALEHVNAGNLEKAQEVLAPFVAASAPK